MTSADYGEELRWLYGLEAARGMDFKLERVSLALETLNNPHLSYPTVHIAGTNGKGSVAAMLHAMLGAAGYRTGLYTSPHLVSFGERIRIGDVAIAPGIVVDLVREIRSAATLRGIELTFFEFVTVMAFLHFARCAVDVAVVEVGLGGRLDATNVIVPQLAAITSIAIDHEEFLGATLQSVAREKAGIIKDQVPIVVGDVAAVAWDEIRTVAAERCAPVHRAGQDFQFDGCRYTGLGGEIGDLSLGLRGSYQHGNAAVAIAAAQLLRQILPMPDEAIRHGLRHVYWPGRLDVIGDAPPIILDAAHNTAGIQTLIRELPTIVGARKIKLLFGVMRDKRWHEMIDTLGPAVSAAIVTDVLPPRGADPFDVARSLGRFCPVSIRSDPAAAAADLLRTTRPDEAALVTGSLFLIGAVYGYLLASRGQRELFTAAAAPRP